MKEVAGVILWSWAALFGAILAYDTLVLPGTKADAKFLGPGVEVETCYQRAARHFPPLEPDLTAIAEAVLASGDIDTLIARRDPETFNLELRASLRQGGERPLSDGEEDAFVRAFVRLEQSGNIYAPNIITRTIDGAGIVAWPPMSCGVAPLPWLIHRVRLVENTVELRPDGLGLETTFVYRPAVAPESCARATRADGIFACSLALDENWNWTFAAYDLERAAEKVRAMGPRPEPPKNNDTEE